MLAVSTVEMTGRYTITTFHPGHDVAYLTAGQTKLR